MNNNNFDLIEQFTRIEWLLHRYHQQNHSHHGPMGDPRRGQGRVLAILKMKPEISQKELSFLLDMTPQSIGEFLSKLEKNGYITRTPSETDRRVMMVRLTDAGIEAAEKEFSFDDLFKCLSEDEQSNLNEYLRRIIESLETELSEERPDSDFRRNNAGHGFRGHFGGHPGGGPFGGGNFDPRHGMGPGFGGRNNSEDEK